MLFSLHFLAFNFKNQKVHQQHVAPCRQQQGEEGRDQGDVLRALQEFGGNRAGLRKPQRPGRQGSRLLPQDSRERLLQVRHKGTSPESVCTRQVGSAD